MPDETTDLDFVSKEWLIEKLRSNQSLVLFDCRGSNEFAEGHIRTSVNFSIPSIMLRRLANGKIDLASTIKCRDLKSRISDVQPENIFVLFCEKLSGTYSNSSENISPIFVLYRKIKQDGGRVCCLRGENL